MADDQCDEEMSAPRGRLNLVLHEDTRGRLEILRERMDADSVSAVVRHAVAAYERLSAHVRDGGKIILLAKDGTERELLLE